jgi:hypothetical protein
MEEKDIKTALINIKLMEEKDTAVPEPPTINNVLAGNIKKRNCAA